MSVQLTVTASRSVGAKGGFTVPFVGFGLGD